MKLQAGWTFLGILKNIFFTLLFLQVLPFLIVGIKNSTEPMLHTNVEVGYIHLRDELSDSAAYVRQFEEFERNPSIEGVIVKADSPGGLPGSSQAVLKALLRCKDKKPVIVFIENLCASGSYYAVCGATKIYGHPSSLVGSIGAAMRVPNVKELLESWKIKNTYVQAGEYKTALDPLKEIKPSDLAYMQTLADDTYNQFITDVALQRGLDKEKHTVWANGKIFSGNQALQLGLIDELGSYGDAVDHMAKLLEADPEEIKLIASTHGVQGFMRRFLSGDEHGSEMGVLDAARIARFAIGVYQQAMIQLGSSQPTLQV